MSGADPVLAAWAERDPSDPGWAQARKAIEAYEAGDLVEASSRAQAVRDAWGNQWAPLCEVLWVVRSESETGGIGFGRQPTRLKRWLDAVARRIGPVGRALRFLDTTLDGIGCLFLLVLLVVGAGIECVRCVNPSDEPVGDQTRVEPSRGQGIEAGEAVRPVRPVGVE